MVPSEWSTGEEQRRGSITKVGVPAIRRIIVEMVWRMILFQPQYKPVQKWQEALRGTNPAAHRAGFARRSRHGVAISSSAMRPNCSDAYATT